MAIGASTGGPQALQTVLGGLPADLPAFVFVVQHIHPRFTPMLARRLGERSALAVHEAGHGDRPEMGTAYLAPGDAHLWLAGSAAHPILQLSHAPPLHGVRPCADVLFASVADAFRHRAVAVILTGMGRDGLEGCRAVKERGGVVLAEAEETCAVFGMPRALIEAGMVDRVVAVGNMAGAITRAVAEVTRPGARWQRAGARRPAGWDRSMAR